MFGGGEGCVHHLGGQGQNQETEWRKPCVYVGGGGSGEGMGAWEGRSSKAEPYSASSGQPERSGGVTAGW